MFYKEPTKWFKSSQEKKADHLKAFLKFVPVASDLYVNPSNAGLKGKEGKKKCARRVGEPELFLDPFTSQPTFESTQSFLTPLKLKKTGPESFTISEQSTCDDEDDQDGPDPLDPNRTCLKSFTLVHRKDKINCPTKITRCHSCKLRFEDADIVLVKTQGEREWFDKKNGKSRKSSGNVYIHYLRKCLEEYDLTFNFSYVIVLKETLKHLPVKAVDKFRKQGLKIQK